MYARLINILFRPETLGEVTNQFRSASTPMIASHAGCTGILATTNVDSGRIYLLTLWDSAEHREASSVHPDFMQAMASYGKWMAGGFNRDSFDVIGETLRDFVPDNPHASASTRFTFITTEPDGWDTSLEAYARLLSPDAYAETGFQGVVLLANRVMNELVLIDLWETREQMVNTDGIIFNTSHQLRMVGAIASVPTHDVVEAVVRV